jgi:hypothetical protein
MNEMKPTLGLQEKIQKLIDGYAEMKKKYEVLEKENISMKAELANSREKESQLMKQLDDKNNQLQDKTKQLSVLEEKNEDMFDLINRFEELDNDLTSQIDELIPLTEK